MHVEDRDVGGLLAGRGLGRGERSRLPAGALPLAGTPSFDNAHPVRSFPTTTVTGAIPEPTDTDTLPTPSKSRTRWPRPTSSGEPHHHERLLVVETRRVVGDRDPEAARQDPFGHELPTPGTPFPLRTITGTASSAGPRTRRRAPASPAPRSAEHSSGHLFELQLHDLDPAAAPAPAPPSRPGRRRSGRSRPSGRAFSSVSRTTWSPAVTPGAGSSSIEPRSSPSAARQASAPPSSSASATRSPSSIVAWCSTHVPSRFPTAVAACRPGRPSASPTVPRPGRGRRAASGGGRARPRGRTPSSLPAPEAVPPPSHRG